MTAVARKQLPLRPAGPDTVDALLAWYDEERRDLPWRVAPGKRADPYRVWLSEIMLQQTTVKAVIPFYLRFLARWPTVKALAAAALDDVLAAWAGLGYYSRARNLHKCAVAVAEGLGGKFPGTAAELQQLPGIGPYTAAAIAAIAFGEAATPVDGNIERVVARLFAVRQPLPAAKSELKRLAATLTPARRAGDFAQAMMDLGAGICTPRRPSCLVCPVQQDCAAAAHGIAASLPLRLERTERPQRVGFAFVALREDGHVLLRKRPEAGLLGGMLEVPVDGVGRSAAAGEGSAAFGAVTSRLVGGARHRRARLHALPAGAHRLSRAGAGGCHADLLGRARTLPLGGAPRSFLGRRAERHAQGHRPRPERELGASTGR